MGGCGECTLSGQSGSQDSLVFVGVWKVRKGAQTPECTRMYPNVPECTRMYPLFSSECTRRPHTRRWSCVAVRGGSSAPMYSPNALTSDVEQFKNDHPLTMTKHLAWVCRTRQHRIRHREQTVSARTPRIGEIIFRHWKRSQCRKIKKKLAFLFCCLNAWMCRLLVSLLS